LTLQKHKKQKRLDHPRKKEVREKVIKRRKKRERQELGEDWPGGVWNNGPTYEYQWKQQWASPAHKDSSSLKGKKTKRPGISETQRL